jgi:N-acetylglucosaminyldiphosphoundecaprenol N-acetyl-beta-D-mannosaminyltransferase
VCHDVGGSFDVFAGITKRAPLWMQNCGLEWLYRVIQEPGRMWEKYLVTDSIFLILSIRAIVTACFGRLIARFSNPGDIKS